MSKYTSSEQRLDTQCKMSSIVCACFVLLIFLSSCSHKARRVEDYHSMRMAAAMEAQEKELNNEMRLENLSPEKLVLAGNSYLAHGNHQLAKLHFAMAVKKDSKLASAYIGLGEALVREGDLPKSRLAYEQALAINEEHKTALLALGKICRKQNNNAAARQYLDTAADLYPDDPEILTELAITLDSMGHEAEAEPVYLKVTQLRPYQASAFNNLGFNYLLQEKYSVAVKSFYHALRLEQGNKRIRNNLAVAYLLNREEQKAISLLKGTVGEAGAYNNVGYIYMVHGECDKAEKAFERALDLNPHYYTRASANLEQLKRSCFLPGAISVGHKLLDENELPTPANSTEVTESATVPEPELFINSGKEEPSVQLNQNGRYEKMKNVKVYSGHLRDKPSLNGAVLGYLHKGEKVTEIQQRPKWFFVRKANGSFGWAHESLFSDNDDYVLVSEKSEEIIYEKPAKQPASMKQYAENNRAIIPNGNKSENEKYEIREEVESVAIGSDNVDKIDVSKLVQESFDLVSQGKFATAIEAADKAISINPALINPYINRAWAYTEVGQYDKAIADCNTVLKANPDNALALNNRGLANQRKGELHKAGMDYKKACKLNLEIGCLNYKGVSEIL